MANNKERADLDWNLWALLSFATSTEIQCPVKVRCSLMG